MSSFNLKGFGAAVDGLEAVVYRALANAHRKAPEALAPQPPAEGGDDLLARVKANLSQEEAT